MTHFLRYFAAILLFFFIGLLLLNSCFPLKVNVPYSQVVTDKDGYILHTFLSADDKWRMYTTLPEITPDLQKAILFKEDRYFYYHFGINPLAIGRALFNNILKRKRTSGASTITMQVARLLSPKSRTYRNKIIEIFRAIQIEYRYSKAEILQLYLNLVPYGGNIEGVKSASVLFFGKSPNHLSVAQITALSIIPNRPTSLRLGKHNDKITKERNKWLNILGKAEVFDKQVISDALAEPLNAHRRAAPKFAPHLSYRLKSEYPNNPIISTNLQYNKQQQVATIVSNYIRRIYHQHIRNAAVMVVNNKTMAVEAYIGSADFYNSEDAGQVDGVRAVRSPGSTLKPFLYGMAFDKGLITQKMKVSDVPINFGGYVPVNYDGTYNGSVTVEKALASSLNIPPVKILDNMGVALFVDGLVNAGFRQIKKDRRKLGLSVVLGGCGVRLEELVNLYSSFANKGQYKSLQFIQQDSSQTTQNKPFQARLLSESSAFIITDILSQLTRPDLPQHIESSKNLPIVSWKTGTSYGRRDAWSIGYNGNYTIGVWVGNFSGESVPELTGADIATPLLFALFNSLDYAPVKDWFISPKALDFRWVCSGSGLLPNEFCEDQIMDYYLPMVSPMTICSHLQKVWLSADEKYSYCTSCLPVNNYKTKQFPYFAPEITAYYEKAHIPYEKIPTHNPKCERIFDGKAPEIVSPTNGLEYLIDPLDNNQIMLKCNVTNDVQKVYWYINKDFYQQSSTSASLFFVPKTGKNTITCVDDKGRKHSITITVRSL